MALIREQGSSRLKISNTRIVVVVVITLVLVVSLIGRLLWIQILHPERLIAEGNARVLRNYNYEPPRGLITDRNGKILAISVPVKTVEADPKFLHEQGVYSDRERMKRIAAILEIDLDELYKKTADVTRRFVPLKRYLPLDKAKELKALGKNGINLRDSYLRSYPTGEMNANLVGILNRDGVGVYGVEQSFNTFLTSTSTTQVAKKDKYDHIVENLGTTKKGSQGGHLVLSIDNRLQAVAYASIDRAVRENDADCGTAVLIDVKTGEVLAMANAPAFDPNNRKKFDSRNAKNRAVTDVFEPGSTMKPLVALAALENKATTWGEVFDTRPFIVDGKMVRDSHAMSQGTLADIIKYSSNTGMAHISMRMGPQKIMQLLGRFGFGMRTSSGLVGESSGKLNENRPFWSEIDKATLGFGYGVLVTNLQLASAYATLANNGNRLPVTILRRDVPPQAVNVVSSPQVAMMQAALESVVSNGTGGKAAIDRYRVAGKTGTAKIAVGGTYGKDYIATFAGFAPISNPRFALVVVITAPKAGKFYGGLVSGPSFSEIMSRALQLYNIKPDVKEETN